MTNKSPASAQIWIPVMGEMCFKTTANIPTISSYQIPKLAWKKELSAIIFDKLSVCLICFSCMGSGPGSLRSSFEQISSLQTKTSGPREQSPKEMFTVTNMARSCSVSSCRGEEERGSKLPENHFWVGYFFQGPFCRAEALDWDSEVRVQNFLWTCFGNVHVVGRMGSWIFSGGEWMFSERSCVFSVEFSWVGGPEFLKVGWGGVGNPAHLFDAWSQYAPMLRGVKNGNTHVHRHTQTHTPAKYTNRMSSNLISLSFQPLYPACIDYVCTCSNFNTYAFFPLVRLGNFAIMVRYGCLVLIIDLSTLFQAFSHTHRVSILTQTCITGDTLHRTFKCLSALWHWSVQKFPTDCNRNHCDFLMKHSVSPLLQFCQLVLFSSNCNVQLSPQENVRIVFLGSSKPISVTLQTPKLTHASVHVLPAYENFSCFCRLLNFFWELCTHEIHWCISTQEISTFRTKAWRSALTTKPVDCVPCHSTKSARTDPPLGKLRSFFAVNRHTSSR